MVATADVTDQAQLSALKAQIIDRFGPINGIIHAAGTHDTQLISDKTIARSERVFASKVDGTRNLDAVFGSEALDFIILCSSISKFTGGLGLVDYAAANAYLDAYALKGMANGRRIIAINWDAWRDVGMAAAITSERSTSQNQNDLQLRLGTEEAIRALRWIVSGNDPQVIVSKRYSSENGEFAKNSDETDEEQSTASSGQQPHKHLRPALSSVYVAPSTETEKLLAGLWADTLKLQKVGIHDNFFELGGHSLLGASLVARINAAGLPVLVRHLFEYQTISTLATAIDQAFASATGKRPRPAFTTPYVAPDNEISSAICAIWENVLSIHPIGIHDSFQILGGNSIHAEEILTQLDENYPVHLPLQQITALTTVAELADITHSHLLQYIESMDESKVQEMLTSSDETRIQG
jgi:hypothetical protein